MKDYIFGKNCKLKIATNLYKNILHHNIINDQYSAEGVPKSKSASGKFSNGTNILHQKSVIVSEFRFIGKICRAF